MLLGVPRCRGSQGWVSTAAGAFSAVAENSAPWCDGRQARQRRSVSATASWAQALVGHAIKGFCGENPARTHVQGSVMTRVIGARTKLKKTELLMKICFWD